MPNKQVSLWENERQSMADAIELSIASLNSYGLAYDHWSIAYSGGKDSSATVSFILWAIKTGRVQRPKTLTVLYADTRQELTPLQLTAMRFLEDLRKEGVDARIVLPELDNRFYVYMLGRGVPPPSNTFRWCTDRIKIQPMLAALQAMHAEHGQRFLQITGVRMGESAARDQRIAISCTSNKGECGQGWFQQMSSEAISDTLAPLVHWRTCFVWDWLYDWYSDSWAQFCGYEHGHGRDYLGDIAAAYGNDDARTGCIGCNLASRDVALENIVYQAEWQHLRPLLEIKPMFAELKKSKNRIRKATPETTKAGKYAKNGQRMGPLTMEARAWGLAKVLDIQTRAGIDLINAEEEARIRELWALNTWPEGWQGGLDNSNHILASELIDGISVIDDELITQPTLFEGGQL
jgi:DNA sulfur modification protein DndC